MPPGCEIATAYEYGGVPMRGNGIGAVSHHAGMVYILGAQGRVEAKSNQTKICRGKKMMGCARISPDALDKTTRMNTIATFSLPSLPSRAEQTD